MALAAVACFGCKDKQSGKPAEKKSAAKTDTDTPRPTLETPDITGPGLEPAVNLGPKITVSKTEIKLDGQSVITLNVDGTIDKSRLTTLTRLLEEKAVSDAPIAIAFDATMEYRRVAALLSAFKNAGFNNLALLVGSGSQMIPIELPDASEANRGGVRPMLTIQKSQLTLWSASGEEGTKANPKLTLNFSPTAPDFRPVTRALAEIVQRRWPSGKRADEDRTIIVQPDGGQPTKVLLQALAAVRADGSLELFPNIFLAGGR